jgi:hypothetical protein
MNVEIGTEAAQLPEKQWDFRCSVSHIFFTLSSPPLQRISSQGFDPLDPFSFSNNPARGVKVYITEY